jgi:hypothetical protein
MSAKVKTNVNYFDLLERIKALYKPLEIASILFGAPAFMLIFAVYVYSVSLSKHLKNGAFI